MDDSFTIQISSNLVSRLVDDGEKTKKKTKRSKSYQKKEVSKPLEAESVSKRWPIQTPVILPLSPLPPRPANAEIAEIRAILQESEKVVERLQKHEEDMVKGVTDKAKNLHNEEFKLPSQKPMPCLDEISACSDCYREHARDPLRCAQLVKNFAECARRARQKAGLPAKQPS